MSILRSMICVSLFAVSQAPAIADESSCEFHGLTFFNEYCSALLEAINKAGEPNLAQVAFTITRYSTLTCEMLRSVTDQQSALKIAGSSWRPDVAEELATLHRIYFVPSSQSALGIATIDLAQSSCGSGSLSSLFFWSGGSIVAMVTRGCSATRVLFPLRLSSLCDGTLSVAKFVTERGSGENAKVSAYTSEVDLSDARSDAFAPVGVFRNRSIDIQLRASQ